MASQLLYLIRATVADAWLASYAAFGRTVASILAPILSRAISRSQVACIPNQNSALVLKYLARRKAVSGVTARLRLMMSLMRINDTRPQRRQPQNPGDRGAPVDRQRPSGKAGAGSPR